MAKERERTSDPGADPLLGSRVGVYRVERFLGAGGMGAVYFAVDVTLDRPVALKVLSLGSPRNVRRFVTEARRQARLDHPNVVAVHGAGTELCGGHEIHYIAMQYVEGKSLLELVRERGALAPTEATRLVLDVARGLAYVHREGFVHRDVKPANVLVDGTGRARISDFGVALGDAVDDVPGTGEFLGTWRWAAPEQVSGGPVDSRSDQFSLAAAWHFALTGVEPDESGPAPQRFAIDPAWPQPLRRALQRMLAQDPGERFADDGECVRAIEDALAALHGSGVAVPDARAGALSIGRFGVTALALVVLVLALFLWNLEHRPAGAKDPGAAAAPAAGVPAPFSPRGAAADEVEDAEVGGEAGAAAETAPSPPPPAPLVLEVRRLAEDLREGLLQLEAEPEPEGGAAVRWARLVRLFGGRLAEIDELARRRPDDLALRRELDAALVRATPAAERIVKGLFLARGSLEVAVAPVPRIAQFGLLLDEWRRSERPFLAPLLPVVEDEGWVDVAGEGPPLRPLFGAALDPVVGPTRRAVDGLAARLEARLPTRAEWESEVAPLLYERFGLSATERLELVDWDGESYGAGLVGGEVILRRWTGLLAGERIVRFVREPLGR